MGTSKTYKAHINMGGYPTCDVTFTLFVQIYNESLPSHIHEYMAFVTEVSRSNPQVNHRIQANNGTTVIHDTTKNTYRIGGIGGLDITTPIEQPDPLTREAADTMLELSSKGFLKAGSKKSKKSKKKPKKKKKKKPKKSKKSTLYSR
jgi:hypothetical protein